MKIRQRKTIIQDHAILANRLYKMASAIRNKREVTDDTKRQIDDLEEQASIHKKMADLFKPDFTMIL